MDFLNTRESEGEGEEGVQHPCSFSHIKMLAGTRTAIHTFLHAFSPTPVLLRQVSSDETERLIKMEEVLHGRVIGQEEAVSAIARAIRRARVGLKNPSRPIASFIFAGEHGGAGRGWQSRARGGYGDV